MQDTGLFVIHIYPKSTALEGVTNIASVAACHNPFPRNKHAFTEGENST